MTAKDVFIFINNVSVMIAIGSIPVAAFVLIRRLQGWKLTWTYRGRVQPWTPGRRWR